MYNTRVKRTGKGCYSVQANDGPHTRYFEIGKVWREGSKWRASGDEGKWGSKMIAVALIKGRYALLLIEQDAVADEREAEVEAIGDGLEKWLGKWPKGTVLRHLKFGYVGKLETTHDYHPDKGIRYGIAVMGGKAQVCGWEKDFVEVEED